jgi:GDPmannose 4,6-dehydratase
LADIKKKGGIISSTALVFGVSGQDGSLLAQLLLSEGWTVHGTSRNAASHDFRNLERLGIRGKITLHSCDTTDLRAIAGVVARSEPDTIYNLGGLTSVGLSFEQPEASNNTIAVATLNILEAIRTVNPRIKFYSAASSECFGNTPPEGADEATPFQPRSPYAVAKAAAFLSVAKYRDAYGMFAASGILFNHESPLRPDNFVTQKIVRGAQRIASGELKGPLQLGNLDVRRDWGWAPEFVRAMWLMMQQPEPEDFVIATGTNTSLREFAAAAFAAHGLDWQQHVVSSPQLLRPTDVTFSVGRPARALERLGWSAETRMPDLVRRLVAGGI